MSSVKRYSHIAVLMGGDSVEREVSLRSGAAVANALADQGYEITTVDLVGLEFPTTNGSGADITVSFHDLARFSTCLREVDAAFIALHGGFGEDGTLQGVLDALRIPYTSSGVRACALAMHKGITKQIASSLGISVPGGVVLERGEVLRTESPEGLKSRNYPVVVKPACQGSTIGVSIVHKEQELEDALDQAARLDEWILVEDYIEGVEVTVAVLGDGGDCRSLPVIEIVSQSAAGFYDYEAKYAIHGSEHIVPARLAPGQLRELEEAASTLHRALGCRGVTRSDFRVGTDGTPYFLEINTVPGMTATSLVPDAARAAGMEFADLVALLVEHATFFDPTISEPVPR